MSTRCAIAPTWMVSRDDGRVHLVVQKHVSTDGTIVKAMCSKWFSPAPGAEGGECPTCGLHSK